MTDAAPPRATLRELVRPEALEHHARGDGPGRLLDVDQGRTTWAFRALLIAVLASAGVASIAPVDEETVGRARALPDGSALVVVRGGAQPRLRPGQAVQLELDGRSASGRITSIGTPARADQVAGQVGGLPDGVADGDVVATARVVFVAGGDGAPNPPVDPGATGTARVLLGRRSLAEAFVRQET